MSSLYKERTLSLIEKKKQQWAREREELSELGVPWGGQDTIQYYGRTYPKYRSNTKPGQASDDYPRRPSQDIATPLRRPSLPPLYRNQHFTYSSNEKLDRDGGGETSGYGSGDTIPYLPQEVPSTVTNWQLSTVNGTGYESSSSGREDRPKWTDRNACGGGVVHTNILLGSGEKRTRDAGGGSQVASDTPGWVKRGLERDGELIVSNCSPAESPEQDYGDRENRPGSGSTGSINRSYIRGQNVHIEPLELAARERRRQVALAHQQAIRDQLAERDQRRTADRESQRREELAEEQRIQREQLLERQRADCELRRAQQKLEREQQRKEAIQRAIALAESQAKEDRARQRRQRMNISENVLEIDKLRIGEVDDKKEFHRDENKVFNCEESKVFHCQEERASRTRSVIGDVDEKSARELKEDLNNETNFGRVQMNNSKNLVKGGQGSSCSSSRGRNGYAYEEDPVKKEQVHNKLEMQSEQQQAAPIHHSLISEENLALVQLPTGDDLHNVQFAFFMPNVNTTGTSTASGATTIPIAVPIAFAPHIQTTTTAPPSTITENRILTPTQYRGKNTNKTFRDSSTQTEPIPCSEQSEPNSLLTIDLNTKKARQTSRSTATNNEVVVEDRPKWGVNRPPTRYLKQSEKDLTYQRRKTRQKMKLYEDKVQQHSSDDSGSPRMLHKSRNSSNGCIGRRRAMWQRRSDVRVLHTEIVPLEVDRERIYYKTSATSKRQQQQVDNHCHNRQRYYHRCYCCCCCHPSTNTINRDNHNNDQSTTVDILNLESPGRMVTTECYMQEQRLYHQQGDEENDQSLDCTASSPRESVETTTGGGTLLPECPVKRTSTLSDRITAGVTLEESASLLEKLQSLHHGLALKHAQYDQLTSS